MPDPTLPTLLEAALGGMLQDIGSFLQRAYGGTQHTDPAVRQRAAMILPAAEGHHASSEALWTVAFFQWLENEGLSFLKLGNEMVNLHRVRDMAVSHHQPASFGALGWLAAEASRLASGKEHQRREEGLESEAEQSPAGEAFARTPLLSPFCQVNLGLAEATPRYQPLTEWIPDDNLMPLEHVDTSDYPNRYRELWEAFAVGLKASCRLENANLFCEALLSLLERYTSTIPSSIADLPDISLHDHSRTVAAVTSCLYGWHAQHGSLQDEAAVRDRDQPKFRFLAGELAGFKHTLLMLANRRVSGIEKILRGRSFLMKMLLEAAILRCRTRLGLPAFNLLDKAGGRFALLVPDLPEVEHETEALRAELDAWMLERYFGELALNLVLSAPFSANALLPAHFHKLQESLSHRLDKAKLQTLRGQPTGVREVTYEFGACDACGRRPASGLESDSRRCLVCQEEHRVGAWLARTTAVSWQLGRPADGDRALAFFGGLCLFLHGEESLRFSTEGAWLSGFRLYRGEASLADFEEQGNSLPWTPCFLANYVPTLAEDEAEKAVYADLDSEESITESGEMKTFAMLARDGLEDFQGKRIGAPLLAVLKAGVDRLALLFGMGLSGPDPAQSHHTLSRHVALSRRLELFFSGYLPQRLRDCFPTTYTVCAGSKELLLIGPWWQMVQLAADLNSRFRLYTGDNPNITLSAGLALMKANHFLPGAVREAEERLARAKFGDTYQAGYNRVCLIDEQPISWERLSSAIQGSEKLSSWLRTSRGLITTAVLYRLLYFADQRHRVEREMDMVCATWRARWGYYLAHQLRDRLPDRLKDEIINHFNRLLGLDKNMQKIAKAGEWQPAHLRIPVSIALYRNHS